MSAPLRVVAPSYELVLPALRSALNGGPPLLVSDDARAIEAARPSAAVTSGIAVLVATSGSTGRPKLVELSLAALTASGRGTEQVLGGPAQWLLALPLHYIAGLQVVARSILADTEPGTLPPGPFTAQAFVEASGRLDGDRRYVSIVPTQLRRLLAHDAGRSALQSFDAVLVGGAATPPALQLAARSNDVRIVTTYGMTETAGGCVYGGHPLPGVTVGLDEAGTVLLGGATVARGYRGDPDATTAAFVDGAFHTEDLGEIAADGSLTVLGRADEMIISGGVNVHPLAVEAVLAQQAGVIDCAVAGIVDDEWGQVVIAWVVGDAPDDTLRTAVRGELGAAAVPKEIRRIESLPLLPSGKPDRRVLSCLH
ncbi:MAG: AMP-binding protein [Jatrophihabitans sp.]